MNEVVRTAKTSAHAIWSLVLGILSLLCFGLFAGIPAVICGHAARSKVRQSQGALTGDGMALAGLILGYIGLVITTIAIIAAIIVPNFIAYKNKATCALVEMEANNTLSALEVFYADPNNTHLPSLDELVSVTGLKTDNRISVYLDYNADAILIQAAHNTASCQNGENYVVSITDEIVAQWQ